MANVCLKLKGRTPEVINLEHDFACKEECLCSTVDQVTVELNPKTGDKGVRVTEKRICASLHLLPGVPVEAPDSVLNVPAVQALEAAGRLVLS